MRDYTNLAWPETPFGAKHRPLGKRSDMCAAFAIEWLEGQHGQRLPVAASTVYLRLPRQNVPLKIVQDTLVLGLRTVVVEYPADVFALLRLTDRALSRARRHAVVLAGHHLERDLTLMTAYEQGPLRGATEVLHALTQRGSERHGTALIIDTGAESGTSQIYLGEWLEPADAPPPSDGVRPASVARATSIRCLAVGLTAAVIAGRYRWQDAIDIGEAIDQEAWDLLSEDVDRSRRLLRSASL